MEEKTLVAIQNYTLFFSIKSEKEEEGKLSVFPDTETAIVIKKIKSYRYTPYLLFIICSLEISH